MVHLRWTAKMGSSGKENDVAVKYADELVTLRVNSKPLINSLTMMAEDYIKQATIIVQTIEKHLLRARTEVKLPVLYLIDSIIKNVKRDYITLFAQNIVSTFCGVFERVRADEKTRMQMWKLRQTWSEIFPTNKLYQIDVKARSMDPGWPIAKLPNTSIHVNPKFLHAKPDSSSPRTSPKSTDGPAAALDSGPVDDDEHEIRMREELLLKQKELIELQQKKLELELLHLSEKAKLRTTKGKDKDKEKLLNKAEIAKQRTNIATSIIAKASENKQAHLADDKASNHGTSTQLTTSTSNSSSASSKPESKMVDPREFAADPRLSRGRISHVKSGSQPDQTPAPTDHVKDEQKSPKSKNTNTADTSTDSKEKIKEPKISKPDLADNKDQKRSKSKSDDNESSKDKSWGKFHHHDSPDRGTKQLKGSRQKNRSRNKSESRSPEKRGRSSQERERSGSGSSSKSSERESKIARIETDGTARASSSRKPKDQDDKDSLNHRRSAVLSKRYRKPSELPSVPDAPVIKEKNVSPRPDEREPASEPGDTDLRFVGMGVQDVDLRRTATDGMGEQHERHLHGQERESRPLRGQNFGRRGRRGGIPPWEHRRPGPTGSGPAMPLNRRRNFQPNQPFPEMQQQNVPLNPWIHPTPGWLPPVDEPPPMIGPGVKKPRRSPAFIEDLFGQVDVDLRQVVGVPPGPGPWDNVRRPMTWQETRDAEFLAAKLRSANPEEANAVRHIMNDAITTATETDSKDGDAGAGQLNVQDLLSRLLNAGLLPNVDIKKDAEWSKQTSEATTEGEGNIEAPMDTSEQEPLTPKEPEKSPPTVATPPPALEVVNVALSDNLRERRVKLVNQICTGVQCASCGLRFPPDQSLRYTQHLDWHFRLNRKEKAKSRKAQSRRWYYELADWIQFEEIEDLEERAASLFEFQEPERTDREESETNTLLNPDAYTVAASGFEGALCPQCNEGFETFYDSEEDEWRLRHALVDTDLEGESRLFHPICHEDYVSSLAKQANESMEESTISTAEADQSFQHIGISEPESSFPVPVPAELDVTDSKKADDEEDEVLILKEGKKEVVLMEIALEEDDPIVNASDSDNEVMKSDETEKITKENENETEQNTSNDLNSNIVNNNNSNSKPTLSPIVIQVEDDSVIPGISSTQAGVAGGVFDFALSSSTQQQQQQDAKQLPPITYNSMQFDFPKIKTEPVEWDQLDENQVIMSKEFLVDENQTPMDITLDDDSPSAPMLSQQDDVSLKNVDIDLTADEEEDSQSAPHNTIITAIDGNLEMRSEAKAPLLSVPTKIRINISGVDKSPSHPASSQEQETPKAATDASAHAEANAIAAEPDTNKLESSDHSEKALEEIKRLKPRLVGRKLVNCPPKMAGKEESGLCVIC